MTSQWIHHYQAASPLKEKYRIAIMNSANHLNFELVTHYADVSGICVIDSYKVGICSVYITDDGRYLVVEPVLSIQAYNTYTQMMRMLYYSLEPLNKAYDPVGYIEDHLWKEMERQAVASILSSHFESIRYYLVRDILGYGVLDVLMRDNNVEEITAERFDRSVGVIHRKYSEFNILSSNICFERFSSMDSFIHRIMQKTGNVVTAAMPITSATTAEGDRVTVTYGSEVSLQGPTINVRKFTRTPLTIADLLRLGTINYAMAAYLWMLMDAKSFGLVVGETGSGKTAMVNALAGLSNPRWKVITIEETPELRIPHYRWIRLTTRVSPMITQSNFDITIMDLIRASLRMRPDFEIVGEVRGQEAKYLFQSAATGHGGLTTIHASSAESALNRLASEPISIRASQQMLLWYVVHVTRLKKPDGKTARKIISVKEVIPQDNSVLLNGIFTYEQKTDTYDTETVGQILKNSKRIYEAANMLNVEPAQDLQRRLDLLKRCKEYGTSFESAYSVISEYYKTLA